MQAFISKYGLAAHLAFLAVSPLFLFPYCGEGAVASVLLWLSALGFVWLLMEPSRRSDEMLHDARVRVRLDLLRDPLFWILLFLIAMAGFRALNGDVVASYDEDAERCILSGPWCSFLPGHAASTGFVQFAATVAVAVVVEGCRYALGKSARISFAAVFAILAGVAGVSHAIACFCGNSEVISSLGFSGGVLPFASTDSLMVSSAGNAFGLAFIASIVSSAGMFECKWHRMLLLFAFAVGGTAIGLFFFATPFQLFVYLALGILLFLVCFAHIAVLLTPVDVLKFVVTIFIATIVPIMVLTFFTDGEIASVRAQAFANIADFPDNLFPEGFWERRAALSAFSMEAWRSTVWIGNGVGAFPAALSISRAAAEIGSSPAPMNGWWCMLVERGIVGAIAFLVPLGFILFTGVLRALRAIGRPVFYPLVALGVLGALAVTADAFLSSSLLRPDTILPAAAFLTLAGSAFPAARKREPEAASAE